MKVFSLLLIVFFTITVSAQTIEVAAGAYERYNTPVTVRLKKPLPANSGYQIINTTTGITAPAQLPDSHTLVFILPEKVLPGNKVRYRLQPVAPEPATYPVRVEQEPAGLMVLVKGQPLLFYHTLEAMPPSDSPAYYRRSGFIHPLFSPKGKILTDDFPAGHTHQHGLFHAWVNTTFKKHFVDFWNQHNKTGNVEHAEVLRVTEGPVMAEVQVLLRYVSFQHGEVLREQWTMRFYPFNQYYLFDCYLEQRNITSDTLHLNKYHYGGMALRGSRQWNPADSLHYTTNWHVLTSEGLRDAEANHTRARWVDAYGIIDGAVAGVTVYDHPSNFRYPQPVRVHPTMPYWVYAPMVAGAFTINPGGTYRAQYRYFVHDGTTDKRTLEAVATDWTKPAVAIIK